MFKNSIPLSLNLVSQNICGVKIALALHNFFASRSHGTVTLKLGLNCILRTFVQCPWITFRQGEEQSISQKCFCHNCGSRPTTKNLQWGGTFFIDYFPDKAVCHNCSYCTDKDLQWRGTFVINYFPDKAFCHNCGSRPTTKDLQWGGGTFFIDCFPDKVVCHNCSYKGFAVDGNLCHQLLSGKKPVCHNCSYKGFEVGGGIFFIDYFPDKAVYHICSYKGFAVEGDIFHQLLSG